MGIPVCVCVCEARFSMWEVTRNFVWWFSYIHSTQQGKMEPYSRRARCQWSRFPQTHSSWCWANRGDKSKIFEDICSRNVGRERGSGWVDTHKWIHLGVSVVIGLLLAYLRTRKEEFIIINSREVIRQQKGWFGIYMRQGNSSCERNYLAVLL